LELIERLSFQLDELISSAPKRQGVFITFEGGDGAGKTTQIRLLSEKLQACHLPHLVTREPGGTPSGEKIRALLVKGAPEGWDGISEAFLVAAARREHLRNLIWPALQAGTWVLCDRFSDSTFAYQGFGHQLGIPFVQTLHHLTMGDFQPDLTFLLQLEENFGLGRKKKMPLSEDRYESFNGEFHKRVSEGYQSLLNIESGRFVPLNAEVPMDELASRIWETLEERGLLKEVLPNAHPS
jgi:dTMP kinase